MTVSQGNLIFYKKTSWNEIKYYKYGLLYCSCRACELWACIVSFKSVWRKQEDGDFGLTAVLCLTVVFDPFYSRASLIYQQGTKCWAGWICTLTHTNISIICFSFFLSLFPASIHLIDFPSALLCFLFIFLYILPLLKFSSILYLNCKC